MPEMTMTEAAKWAGTSRTTVFKAIKSGKISARKNEDGEYRIDPAELERVFKPASTDNVTLNGNSEREDIGGEIAGLRAENALLREMANKTERQVEDLRGERDRLLGVIESQTRLLTDQRQAKTELETRKRWWKPWS